MRLTLSIALLLACAALAALPVRANDIADCDDVKDADRTIAACTALIQRNPSDSIAYYNRSAAYLRKGQRDQAIADFRSVVAIEPENKIAKDGLQRLARKR